MGSLNKMEPHWWETKPQRLNEWVYEWRKQQYHKNPRTICLEDYELTRIADLEKELQEKLRALRNSR